MLRLTATFTHPLRTLSDALRDTVRHAAETRAARRAERAAYEADDPWKEAGGMSDELERVLIARELSRGWG